MPKIYMTREVLNKCTSKCTLGKCNNRCKALVVIVPMDYNSRPEDTVFKMRDHEIIKHNF